MTVELESGLEEKLLEDLRNNGYERITIKDNKELEENFKKQLENFNEIKLTNEEFDEILRELKKGTIFDKAQLLRDSYTLKRKNKPNKWIYFINKEEWCKNIFQVTNQIKSNNKYDHRYDVTILINGLPLVQIELKKKGVELKKAFNQIKQRYLPNFKGLFQYIQIFIITNSVNTKYFATGNARSIKYESTYFWKDKKNKNIKQLSDFTKTFLEPCTLAKMITKFMILNESDKKIMILRAYQKYAVEEIIRYAIDIKQNGYIYHTTGSGKTLTSYKTSQLLTEYPEINKVIFVVDRKDLDTQTIRKFNEYSEDDIKQVNNTNALIRKLISEDKLIVTTIQKLDNVVRKHQTKVNKMKNKKIIFIYDECHRSQFGKMHQRITNYFQNNLCFGFTGTPIFTENSNGLQTTKSIFGKQLHRYMIKDAIRDKNVLGFSIKYYGKGKNKSNKDSKVKKIDTNEWLLNNNRIEQNVNKIIETYPYKTQDGKFNAMLTINRGDMIDKYYKLLKEKAPNLNIAVIYTPDENNSDENEKSNEEYIKEYIKDYNKLFETNFTTETKDEYRINISNKMETGEIDLLMAL